MTKFPNFQDFWKNWGFERFRDYIKNWQCFAITCWTSEVSTRIFYSVRSWSQTWLNFLWILCMLFPTGFPHKKFVKLLVISNFYTQYPIIRNGLIRNDAEISVNFKKPAFKGFNLRNAWKNLRNAERSDFHS